MCRNRKIYHFTFHHFNGRNMNHVTVFDGRHWQPLGAGIPFDQVIRGKLLVTDTTLFVAADGSIVDRTGVLDEASLEAEVLELLASER